MLVVQVVRARGFEEMVVELIVTARDIEERVVVLTIEGVEEMVVVLAGVMVVESVGWRGCRWQG